MKIGRNELCPCESGKKYKNCCLGKQEEPVAENDYSDPEIKMTVENDYSDTEIKATAKNDYSDIGFKSTAFLIRTINKIRTVSLRRKPHIKEYQRVRKLHIEVVDSMVSYFESGKFEKKVIDDYIPIPAKGNNGSGIAAADTCIFFDSVFDTETREGVHGFYDVLIYKTAPNVNCITEEFIKNHRYKSSQKIEFLQCMMESKLGLYEVTGVDNKEGYAYLKEVFNGSEYRITDIGISGQKNYDSYYIYTRIITYNNVCFGTGLNFIFIKTDPFIINYIKQQKKDYNPQKEIIRFTELYNHYSKNPNETKVIENKF